VNFEGKVLIGSSIWPSLLALIKTEPTSFTGFEQFEASIFTGEGFVLSLLLVAIPVIMVSLLRMQTPSKPVTSKRNQAV